MLAHTSFVPKQCFEVQDPQLGFLNLAHMLHFLEGTLWSLPFQYLSAQIQ